MTRKEEILAEGEAKVRAKLIPIIDEKDRQLNEKDKQLNEKDELISVLKASLANKN